MKPIPAVGATIAVIGATMVAAPALVFSPVLAAIGFTGSGVVAGKSTSSRLPLTLF